MSKKTFKDNTANLDRLFSNAETQNTDREQNTQNTYETPNTYNTQETPKAPDTQDTPKPYRINLKLRPEYKEYLSDEAWKARKSITDYINDLIKEDMDSKDIQST